MKQQKGQNLPDTTMLLEFQMHYALKVTKEVTRTVIVHLVKYNIIYKLIYNVKAKWFISYVFHCFSTIQMFH